MIVDEEEEVAFSPWCSRHDRPTEIAVYEVKKTLGTVLGCLRECGAPLLPCKTTVANLVDMVHLWQSSHHVVASQPLKHVKVEVTIACVPPPGDVVVMRNQANRLHNVQSDNIQPVSATVHLGKEAALSILNLENAVFDQHLAAALV